MQSVRAAKKQIVSVCLHVLLSGLIVMALIAENKTGIWKKEHDLFVVCGVTLPVRQPLLTYNKGGVYAYKTKADAVPHRPDCVQIRG